MKLKVDSSKCDRCGLCFEACPQLCGKASPNIFFCEQNECAEKACMKACDKKAIIEIDGFCYIDYALCNKCGKCAEACDAVSMAAGGFPAKCTLCGKCVDACPQKAISFSHSERESAELRENVGWWKIPCEAENVIEDSPDYSLAKVAGKEQAVLKLKIVEMSYFEMKTVGLLREDDCSVPTGGFSEKVKSEIMGFSVLDRLLAADWLEEISAGAGPVRVYHKKHGWLETDLCISDKKIIDIANKISKPLWRRLTLQNPRINAGLDFGRIHAAIPPVAKSPSLTIRKFNRKPFSPKDLIDNKTVSSEALAFLSMAVLCDSNILIAGNTGSGKTSLLNTLCSFIPKNERIIVVEETPEVNPPHEHQVRLAVNESLNIKMADLVADTLRMRPDRVIVGEVRTADEAAALMNTMLAGQGKSSFATFHGQNVREAMLRLADLGVKQADLCAFDYIIVIRRWTDFRKSQDVRRVVEIARMKKDSCGTETLFSFDPKKDALKRNEKLHSQKILCSLGLSEKTFEKELARRKKIVEKDCDGNV